MRKPYCEMCGAEPGKVHHDPPKGHEGKIVTLTHSAAGHLKDRHRLTVEEMKEKRTLCMSCLAGARALDRDERQRIRNAEFRAKVEDQFERVRRLQQEFWDAAFDLEQMVAPGFESGIDLTEDLNDHWNLDELMELARTSGVKAAREVKEAA